MRESQISQSKYKLELGNMHRQMESLRKRDRGATDITLAEYVKTRWGISTSAFFEELGIEPSMDTVNNLFTLPDPSYRFLIPEIIREAVRLGLRRAPIWPDVIAAEQPIAGLSATMPAINMSDATPRKVDEGETIPLGSISYGQKKVEIYKMGRGIQMTYEVKDFVAINVLSIFLQDFGVKLGNLMDAKLIDILINGEQADGSAAAPVIGVETANTLTYKDFLRVWVRMYRLGRRVNTMIAGEEMAITTLNLDEFKDRQSGTPHANLKLKTPLPASTNFYIHSSVPEDQVIILDPSAAVIKLNAKPLLIESEKIISNQTLSTYASITTGFATLYTDGRVLMDMSEAFDGFPDELSPELFTPEAPAA